MSFEEQVMSKDKYKSMFLHKIEAIVFIILQIFYNACEKMFANSYQSAAQDFCFWVFSGMTLRTNKYFSSSVTTTKCSLVLN